MLCEATNQGLTKYMDPLIDPMFACGLSEALIRALEVMVNKVPPIKHLIQEKLLDILSLVLASRPYRPVGSPPNRVFATPIFARDWALYGIEHKDPEIALALNTLGSFDFQGELHVGRGFADCLTCLVVTDLPQATYSTNLFAT